MKTKICHYCNQERDISDFNSNKRTRDGYDKRCLYCYAEKNGLSYDDYIWKLLSSGQVLSNRGRNAETNLKRTYEFRQEHPEKSAQYSKQWRKSNPVIARHNARNSNLKRKQREILFVVNDLTEHDWKTIKEQYNLSCAYCGCSNCELTMDHVIPVSRNGQHTKDNIVPACRSCNSKKNAKTPEEAGMRINVKTR